MNSRRIAATGTIFLVSITIAAMSIGKSWQVVQSEITPPGTLPSARNAAASAYDDVNDRIILHSGNSSEVFPDDVWVLSGALSAGTPQWQQLAIPGSHPVSRELHVGAYDSSSNRFIIHGGWPGYADTWVLTNANGLGGTPEWIELPAAPQKRAGAASAYDRENKRFMVFGGLDVDGYVTNAGLNDVWVLSSADGIGTPVWEQLHPAGTLPSPVAGAASAYDPSTNRFIVQGGALYRGDGTFIGLSNQLWVLTHANGRGGTPEWIQLTASGPSPRVSHGLAYDPLRKRAILVGGSDDSGGPTSGEVWILDNADGTTGTPHWSQAEPSGADFQGNIGFAYGYSAAAQQFAMTLGAHDGMYRNDAWLLQLNQLIPDDDSLEVSMPGPGQGAVISVPSGIACPGDCSDAYSAGTIVTLTATPASGSIFVRWDGSCTGGASCTITMDAAKAVSAVFAPPGTDLTVASVGNPPNFITPGQSFTTADETRNEGGTDAAASTTRFYLSLDTVKDSSDIRLSGVRSVPPLSGVSSSTGVATLTVPKSAPLATYWLVACADDLKRVTERSESNNCVASGTALTVARPDLVETVVSNPPANAAPGSKFSVSDTVMNVGVVPAGESTTRYYLSTDAIRDLSDVALAGTRPVPILSAGASSAGSRVVSVPAGILPAAYQLLACADDLAKVGEGDEANNCAASASLVNVGWPDLVVTAVGNPPSTLASGARFTISDTVANAGSLAAGTSTARYYLSADGVKDTGDILLLGGHPVPALEPGGSASGSKTVTVPLGTPMGTYFVLACADDPRKVAESDEANNCGVSSTTVITGFNLTFVEEGMLKTMDLSGRVLQSISLGSDAGRFAISDDKRQLVYLRGGAGAESVWHWDLSEAAPERVTTEPWAANLRWLPGSASAFLYGSAGGIKQFDLVTMTASVWQSADTAIVLFGRDTYRGGFAWDSRFGHFIAELGFGGAGGDGVFGGVACDDGVHHICDLHAISNPAGISPSWASIAYGPAISTDGQVAYFSERLDWETNRVVKLDLSTGDRAVLYEQVGVDTGFGEMALLEDRYLIFRGLPIGGDAPILLCDVAAPAASCATTQTPGRFDGRQVLPLR